MVVTVMKTHHKKTLNAEITNISRNNLFNFELNNELPKTDIKNAELKEFNEIFFKVLDKHAPKKQKYIQAMNSNCITKLFRKKLCTYLNFTTNF